MPVISVRIPQLGEGLQEALLVEFLKKPGDRIKRDQPIYVMETDKATTDVESPYDGTLVEWIVEPGTVLSIGTEIGRMEVAAGVEEMPAGHGPAGHAAAPTVPTAHAGNPRAVAVRSRTDIQIPPRTRRLLKEKGLLDVAGQIPCAGGKRMPEDVEAWLAAGGTTGAATTNGDAAPAVKAPPAAALASNEQFEVVPLSQSQITLNYRLVRGTQATVPVTVMTEVDWTALEAARSGSRSGGGPTAFAMACWCVVQSMRTHDRFRSALVADGRSLKVFRRINLGVAVALPGDLLVTAVVREACQLDQPRFFSALAAAVEQARDGKDQADESTTLTVSNIGKAGMRWGIPAIVTPAMATLAIGQVVPTPVPDGSGFRFRPTVNATLGFDHRVANGVGAANFLDHVRNGIESFRLA
jgi:pyruvate/2-oxoglutarate dehydrogenase complex dihydrolipoamide acyltransferase (E2) component